MQLKWLGTKPVARTKPLELTPAGMLFLDAATNAVETLHTARTQLQDAAPVIDDTLRIATGRTLASTFFPDWYAQIAAQVGAFSAALSTGSAEDAILQLAAGEVDLLIVYSSPHTRLLIDRTRYDWRSVAPERLVPVGALDARGGAVARLRAHHGAAHRARATSGRAARAARAAARLPGRFLRADPARRPRDRRAARLADRLQHRAVSPRARNPSGARRDLARGGGGSRRSGRGRPRLTRAAAPRPDRHLAVPNRHNRAFSAPYTAPSTGTKDGHTGTVVHPDPHRQRHQRNDTMTPDLSTAPARARNPWREICAASIGNALAFYDDCVIVQPSLRQLGENVTMMRLGRRR